MAMTGQEADELMRSLHDALHLRAAQLGDPEFPNGVLRSLLHNILCENTSGRSPEDATRHLLNTLHLEIVQSGKPN